MLQNEYRVNPYYEFSEIITIGNNLNEIVETGFINTECH